jgi:very-short-patch-repair endonuclease
VFTNLSADDIDLSRTQARGVQAFKTFLHYAQSGQLTGRAPGTQPLASPFEEAVYRVLTQAGYQVQSQVGSAGFFIDLAVVHPSHAGRYLLGIECDGANYHRARSARDRDRLRQSVLEGLGWQIYRIWSTDWFRNPEAEQKRLLTALEKALREEGTPLAEASLPPTAALIREKEARSQPVAAPLPLYQIARPAVKTGGRELHEVPANVLSEWVQEVIRVESPVHEEEVLRRIAEAAAVPRIGPRLKTAVETALALAVRQGQVRQQKGMCWWAGMQQPPLRDRSQLPAASRNLTFIAPQEVALAVEKVVGEAFGMPVAEVAPGVARLLGFPRLNEDSREQIEMVTDELVQAGRLQSREGQVMLAPGQKSP